MRKVYTETLVLHEQSAGGMSAEGDGNKTEEEKEEEKEKMRELQEKTTKELEDDPRLQLDKTWTKYFMFQPLWRIRNYFGEKVAMYFAWSGHLIQSLFLPMVAGFAIFIYGLVKRIEFCIFYFSLLDTIRQSFDNDVTPFFAMAICIWGTLFLEFWKRQQNRLSYQWDVDEFEMNEPDRPEFYGTEQKENPVDPDGEKILNYPMRYRICKLAVSGLTLLFMVCLVLCSVVAVIVYRIFTSVDFCPTAPSEVCLMVTTIVSSLLNAVSILILSKLYDWLARKLTDWENHRTQTKYDDSLIIKLFAFQFVNNYTSCFYIAFFRGRFDTGGIFDLGPKYTDKCEGTCMSQLSFQVLTLMLTKPLPKLFSDVVLPFLKRKWRNRPDCMRCNFGCSGEEEDDLMKKAQEDPRNLTFLERELMKEKLGDFTLGEYTEKVIMYGFLMLFAASFPLAPLIAIAVTSVDIRIDANRLLWWFRRPVAFIAQDIGTWQIILQLINFIGVVSNAFLIAFTSNWGSKYNIKDQLWIVIGFEHLVLVLKFVVAYLIPDIPADVALARRKVGQLYVMPQR
ncbi:hypothetical protein FSP39_007371 [Pinctada imbricata]|uniref:Anoctamin n=1 Tax=Pinctada imbricata TaxID=66713 RepID=A0AA88YLZ3_PINIB|nr:hypothetical protein FSP39_007371 [Pinctada imbricata]